MITFEPITKKLIEFSLEIVNSNASYNILENGNSSRTIQEVKSELMNQTTDSYLIISGNKYIGVVDFLENNSKDNCPWIGLLMVHKKYQSMGYGKKAYVSFENRLKQEGYNSVRIGVLEKNINAREFWSSLGFMFYGTSDVEGKIINCFEKQLT